MPEKAVDKKKLKMATTDHWQEESKVLPIFMLVFYLSIIYCFLYKLLEKIEPYLENPFWNMQASAQLYLAMLIILNTALYYLYTRKPEWAMKCRINSVEWPWEQDQEAWRRLLKKSLKRYVGILLSQI